MSLCLVAGCGGGGLNGEQSKSPAQVWSDAQVATLAAKNLHLEGTSIAPGGAFSFDLDMSRSGDGGGTLVINGDLLHLVVASGLVYVKATGKAWTGLGAGKSMAGYSGKWVMVPLSGSPISNFAQFVNEGKFLANLKPKGTLTKEVNTKTWQGRPVVVLADATKAKLYVSARGKPYILHIQGGTASDHGTMTFSHFGSAPLPAAPKGAVKPPTL